MRALVVFSDSEYHPLSWLLKAGYRHVFCAVQDEHSQSWIEYDWVNGHPSLRAVAPLSYDLAEYYADLDRVTEVMEIHTGNTKLILPLLLNNCVGHTRLVCGVDGFALSPHQLRNRLAKGSLYARTSSLLLRLARFWQRPRAAADATAPGTSAGEA